jgi:hypothetical protein
MNTPSDHLQRQMTSTPKGEYARYAQAKGSADQVVLFIAVSEGVKPCMDDWVPTDRLDAYISFAESIGLQVKLESFFVPIQGEQGLGGVVGAASLTTTRARAFPTWQVPSDGQAHVLVGRDTRILEEAAASGWYNVVVKERVVHKPLADYIRFGKVLGYPDCCIQAFCERNNWYFFNAYYEAHKRTGILRWECNSLARHTSQTYLAHIPCSFDCSNSLRYAESVRSIIDKTDRDFRVSIDNFLRRPFLCLSELEIYVFNGSFQSEACLSYDAVAPLPPTPRTRRLLDLLNQGDLMTIDGNLVVISKNGSIVHVYECRGDRLGPEAPFFLGQ